MVRAIRHAREVTFSSYFLWGGEVENALEDAGRHGAAVHVRLEGFQGDSGPLESKNEEVLQRLAGANVDVQLVDRTKNDGPMLHLKAAVCDGVAFLDDCNWRTRGDTIVRDDCVSDALAIRDAALHHPQTRRCSIALNKADALRREHDVLAQAKRGDRVDVETETISWHSPIYSALKNLAAAGVRCRLLANAKRCNSQQLNALGKLAQYGVQVRTTSAFTEKLAVLNSSATWIGSANATSTYWNADCIDWGAQTSDVRVVRMAREHFNSHWVHARTVHADLRKANDS
jgi:hypothetical protein